MSVHRAKIAARAHELWELRGKPEGSPEIDWNQAERELSVDAAEATKPNASVDSLQREAADVSTSASDRGPTASDTETTAPDGPIPKRSRTGRTARQPRENGGARE
jgi:hypothetical protein